MITITNKYNTAMVYSDSIDSGAEGLLRALCASPLAAGSKLRIMPDVHAGKGCAVGTSMTIGDYAVPGLVGVDIGCGILACKVGRRRPELGRLDKIIQERVPAGRNIRGTNHLLAERARLEELRCARHIQHNKALRSIGTYANRQKVVARLRELALRQQTQRQAAAKNNNWRCHTRIERGNAQKVFRGLNFE